MNKKRKHYSPSLFQKIIKSITLSKGAYGEWLIDISIQNAIQGNMKIYKNLYIPRRNSKEDKTSELDIVLVHEKKIFVIESKFYSGWIFGDESSRYWTQVLNKNTKKRFYNPILQNRTHIRDLSQYLGLENEEIVSIIVFSNNVEFKKIPDGDGYIILKRKDLIDFIDFYLENISSMQYNILEIDSLLQFCVATKEIEEKHIQQIHSKYKIDK